MLHPKTSIQVRARRAGLGAALFITTLTCLGASGAHAQTTLSPDPQVRVSQQWEDVLLLNDLDFLQFTPKQYTDMQALAEVAHSRMAELDSQRQLLQQRVLEQHQKVLRGERPTPSDEAAILDKQRRLTEQKVKIETETVDRLAPKLKDLLTKRQVVRAWLLMQGKLPPTEKHIALSDPASGFALAQMDSKDALEAIVRVGLLQKFAPDVIDQALIPWEIAALGLGGLGGPGGGAPGAGGIPGPDTLKTIQDMDPRMGARMLQIGQKFFKMITDANQQGVPVPQVAPEVRSAVNSEAASIRKALETDPETYLTQARAEHLTEAIRPLARRLFLSPRLKEALAERELKKPL